MMLNVEGVGSGPPTMYTYDDKSRAIGWPAKCCYRTYNWRPGLEPVGGIRLGRCRPSGDPVKRMAMMHMLANRYRCLKSRKRANHYHHEKKISLSSPMHRMAPVRSVIVVGRDGDGDIVLAVVSPFVFARHGGLGVRVVHRRPANGEHTAV